jgi:ferredoxin
MSATERKIGKLTVRIERENCIGSRNCMHVAPDLFELDDEGVASFRANATADRDTVIEACQACPVEALHVLDENGRRIVP